MYPVLKPHYTKTGEKLQVPEGPPLNIWRVEWEEIGLARDIQDAKRKFGGYPVLDSKPVGQIH